MFSDQRLEELVSFLNFEKELFLDTCDSIDQEDIDETLSNFNDTIQIIKILLNN